MQSLTTSKHRNSETLQKRGAQGWTELNGQKAHQEAEAIHMDDAHPAGYKGWLFKNPRVRAGCYQCNSPFFHTKNQTKFLLHTPMQRTNTDVGLIIQSKDSLTECSKQTRISKRTQAGRNEGSKAETHSQGPGHTPCGLHFGV